MIAQEYGIKIKPASSGNLQAKSTIEIIHQVLGNIVRTYNLQEIYVDDSDSWMGILAAAAFAVRSTYHRTKQTNSGQLVFGKYMILPINHIANLRYIRQRKQTQIKKDAICENSTRINHDYHIGDKALVRRNLAYKYEALFQGPY